jgi:uncharacterized protein (TIGR02594 family)
VTEPAWVAEARKHIGLKEIPGPRHHPKILDWWKKIKRGGIKSDEVPWCAAFVGGCLEEVGIISSRFESARSYMTWGVPLPQPVLGCVVVFSRAGGGHVGFLTGVVDDGRLLILGGNQNDQVSIAPFDRSRVIGYRWPKAVPITERALPVLASKQRSSTNEA